MRNAPQKFRWVMFVSAVVLAVWLLLRVGGEGLQPSEPTVIGSAETVKAVARLTGVTGPLETRQSLSEGTFSKPKPVSECGELSVQISWLSSHGEETPWKHGLVELEPRGVVPPSRKPTSRETGELGLVHWRGVPAGPYWLKLSGVATRYIDVQAGKQQFVEWGIEGVMTVEGVVVNGAYGGAVPAARIWLSESNKSGSGSMVASADESGYFSFRTKLGGKRYIGAVADGFEMSSLQPILEDQLDGTRSDGLEIVLEPGGLDLQGVVVDQTNNPVPDAEVYLVTHRVKLHAVNGGEVRSFSGPSFKQLSDQYGRFRIKGHSPRVSIGLYAIAEGYACARYTSAGKGKVDTEVVLVMEPESTVSGRVFDNAGIHVAGVTVGVGRVGEPGSQRCVTDDSGSFQLMGLSAGSMNLRLRKKGFESVSLPMEIERGVGIDGLEVRMDRRSGGTVRGSVIPAQSPLGGEWCVVFESDSTEEFCWTKNGHFEISPWPHKNAVVSVYYNLSSSWTALREEIDLTLDERVVVRVNPEAIRTTVVGGHVVGPRGGNQRYTVQMQALGCGDLLTSVANAESGAFSFRVPSQGEWLIEVFDSNRSCLASRRVFVGDGGDFDLGEIELERTGTIQFDWAQEDKLEHVGEVIVHGASGRLVHRQQGRLNRTIDVVAGEYQVVEVASGIVISKTRVVVDSQEQSLVHLLGESSYTSTLSVTADPRKGSWLKIEAIGGEVIYSGRLNGIPRKGLVTMKFSCAPGLYRSILHTGFGETLDSTCTVYPDRDSTQSLE